MRDAVAQTTRTPDVIRKSTRNPDTFRLNYRWFYDTPVGPKWVCVVIKYLYDGEAFITTAYLTDKIKQGKKYGPTQAGKCLV